MIKFTTCYKNDECQAELSTDAINDILQVQKRKERKTNKTETDLQIQRTN